MLFTVDSVKQFLLSKLSAQAAQDGVSLDEIEKKMFFFSEVPGNTDLEAQDAFDARYDDKAYESKVAKLLRRAYASDKRADGSEGWKDALNALRHEDFYGLVMVDQARIPRSHEAITRELWCFQLEWLPFEIVELLVILLGFLVVFRPSVLGLYLPDWTRWLAYLLFVWLAFRIGRVWSRMQIAKAIKRSRPPED